MLVGTPIGNLGDISPRAVEALAGADLIACEDTRRTRALLSAIGVSGGRRLLSVHDHNEAARVDTILARLESGATVALVSDAGMPLVSDPGERLVSAVLAAGHGVEVVPGPSAVLSALVLSGLPAARFCFEGFLPRSGSARRARLVGLATETRTTVLFEAPQRVAPTLADLVEVCGGSRRVAVARELTKRFEEVRRGTLAEMAGHPAFDDAKGEFVIVLAGAEPQERTYTDADIESALRARMAGGADKRAAVATVAADFGIPKRRAYAIATTLVTP